MPGLLRGIARTAVIAATATAVSNRVSRRQASRWARRDQQEYDQQQAYQQEPDPQDEPGPRERWGRRGRHAANPNRYYESIIPASGNMITDLDIYNLVDSLDQSVCQFHSQF